MNRQRLYSAARTAAVVVAVLVLACGTATFFFFGFIGFAAWSDYSFRGCPYAVQCEDSVDVMWIAGLISLACIIFIVLCIWLLFRGGLRRRHGRPVEQE